MHPLTTFPALLTYGLLAPFLIRIVASLFVIYLGFKRYKKQFGWTSIFYVVAGALIFIGLKTQLASIVAIASLKFDFYVDFYRDRKNKPVELEKYILYTIVVVILISLLFTGPGSLAFDLPL